MVERKPVLKPEPISKWIDWKRTKKEYPLTEKPIRMKYKEHLKASPFSEETGRYLIKIFGSIIVGSFSLFGGTLIYCYLLEKELWPMIIFPSVIVLILLVPFVYYFHKMMSRVIC